MSWTILDTNAAHNCRMYL